MISAHRRKNKQKGGVGELRYDFEKSSSDRIIFDEQGKFFEFQSVGQNISTRKRSQEQIAASLSEKEVLLKEIHHRVKNNLQIICSDC